MKRIFAILFVLNFCVSYAEAQTKTTPTFAGQRAKLITYNIGLGGLISGIGAAINHKEKITPKGILLRMGQGMIGGFFNHQAKNLSYKINKQQNVTWAWPARLCDAVGSSIIESSSRDEEMWSRMHFNLSFLRIQWNKDNGYKTGVRFLPNAFYGFMYIKQFGKWDAKMSLQTGLMIYKTDGKIISNKRAFAGLALNNTFAVSYYYLNPHQTIAHELIHTFQYEDFIGINQYGQKLYEDVKSKSKFFSWLDKWMFIDINASIKSGLYRMEKVHSNECYQNNFFELEADHYSAKQSFGICK